MHRGTQRNAKCFIQTSPIVEHLNSACFLCNIDSCDCGVAFQDLVFGSAEGKECLFNGCDCLHLQLVLAKNLLDVPRASRDVRVNEQKPKGNASLFGGISLTTDSLTDTSVHVRT